MKAIVIASVVTLFMAASATGQTFFRHDRQFSVGPNPSAIVAHDLTGNGIPDIITADRGTLMDPNEERPANDELSFLVAEGALNYVTQPPLRAGFAPWAIVVANMDALKAPDLVIGSFHAVRQRNLSLFLNLGDNLFREEHFSVPQQALGYYRQRDLDDRPVFTSPGITAMTVRDFDGDGYRDVIATGWTSDVLIYFPGHPETYLGQPVLIPAPGGPHDIQAADLNGDGQLNLVTTMYSSGEIALWRNDEESYFEEVDRFQNRGRLPHKVRVADMNGNGILDLVVSNVHAEDSIVIYYGNGDFTFPVSQEIMLGEDRNRVEHEIRDIVVEDLTGNGRPDIAAACYASSQVVVFINNSDDEETPQRYRTERYSFGRDGGQPRALCVADFNGNGKLDIGVALWNANAVSVLLAR